MMLVDQAMKRDHLLAGLDEFLDAVTVLPPGEWDPSIRIEPPNIVSTTNIDCYFTGKFSLPSDPLPIWPKKFFLLNICGFSGLMKCSIPIQLMGEFHKTIKDTKSYTFRVSIDIMTFFIVIRYTSLKFRICFKSTVKKILSVFPNPIFCWFNICSCLLNGFVLTNPLVYRIPIWQNGFWYLYVYIIN